jgi:hypothetical protein
MRDKLLKRWAVCARKERLLINPHLKILRKCIHQKYEKEWLIFPPKFYTVEITLIISKTMLYFKPHMIMSTIY